VSLVRLGATVSFAGEVPQEDGRVGLAFAITEWADLEDGQRVTLHDDILGYTSVLSIDDDPWLHYDHDLLVSGVLSAVLPEEDDPTDADEEHPWGWFVELAAEQGLVLTREDLQAVPYDVEVEPSLATRLDG
jgi:hypothetical protein